MAEQTSILSTIKTMLVGEVNAGEFDPFDAELVTHINGALSVLWQLGVGGTNGFQITGSNETWEDLGIASNFRLNMVKNYIYLKIKIVFDPPGSSYALTALKEEANMLEWRITNLPDMSKTN